MLVERAMTLLGIQAVFTRHRPLELSGVPGDVLVSPAEARVDKISRVDRDGAFDEKPVLGRPRRVNLSDLRLPGEARDLFRNGLYLKLYLAPWDRHVVVSPCDGEVVAEQRVHARSLPLVFVPSSDLQNKKHGVLVRTPHGMLYLLMIGSFMVDSLKMEVRSGDRVARGERVGEFRLGSSVVVLLPPGRAEPLVLEDSKVRLGEPLVRWMDR